MDCNEITNSQLLVIHFRKDDRVHLNRVFRCFFDLFFEEFKGYTYKFCFKRPHIKHKGEELAMYAFDDGLVSFYFKIKNEGFKEKGASIKTAFFSFCVKKLWGLTTTERRRHIKEMVVDPMLQSEKAETRYYDEWAEVLDYELLLDSKEELLNKALKELGERGSNLIMWKKILKFKNEEIASRMGIQPNTVPNEVYKSFLKLKEIIDRLKGEQ